MDIKEREFKTTPHQWKMVVDYFEMYPILLTSKFSHFDGDHSDVSLHWENLATMLNSVGVGARTVEKWKMAISRWKSKTKAKASNIRREMMKTGGGPSKITPLTPSEEKLMGIIGWQSITGDHTPEIGVPKQTTTNESTDTNASQAAEASTSHSPPPLCPLSSIENLQKRKMPIQLTTDRKNKKTRTTSDKTRRFVSLHKMHNESLGKLTMIEKNTSVIASALMAISEDVKRYVNVVTGQE